MSVAGDDVVAPLDADRPTEDDEREHSEQSADPEPNLGAFLLTVGGVTVMFIAVFQFTLSAAVAQLLTAAVLAVTVTSVAVGLTLDLLGYFDEPRPTTAAQPIDEPTPWVPTTGVRQPLPPMLDFDEELAALQAAFGGEFPRQMEPFLDGYRRLKTTGTNRHIVVSDLRAALNPVTVLAPDSEAEAIIDEIGARLFRYIDRDAAAHLRLTGLAFHEVDGDEASIPSLRSREARLRGLITNEGEAVSTELAVVFRGADGGRIDRTYVPLGTYVAGASRPFDVAVYVPAAATDADVTVTVAAPSAGNASTGPSTRSRTNASGTDRPAT